jgi:DNA-binding transcriptional ArsR family regulator
MVTMTTADGLSQTFHALSDPTRRAILERLARGPATVKELAAPFAISGPAVSKHLRVLERAGLIVEGRDAQRRPRRIDPTPLKAVAQWADSYRRFWDESFDRLDSYLHELQAARASSASARGGRGRRKETKHGGRRRKR